MAPELAAPAPELARRAERIAARWRRALREPDWYLRVEGDLRRYILRRPTDAAGWRVRWLLYDLAADAMQRGEVAVAAAGPDLDAGRAPVRFAVLHHSATVPDVSAARLSAMGLLRLYAPAALRRGGREALYSNHWSGGTQVFYAYHWLVRPDGGVERLLQDRHVGWHAGDWEVNRASVGICLAGDYSRQRPTAAALAAVRGVLRRYPGATLMLHREVNGATDCPGPWASAGELACACP